MEIGAKLGKYVIKRELGRGSMGVVYLAEDQRLGRPVALKWMSSNVAGDADLLKRFYREAQSAGQLRHPNIVTIYDIDESGGIPFIAMEFLEGESVEKIIASRKELPVAQKIDILAQSCRGLHYAHEHGIVHRDVKPANIVVLNDGLVKIVDFGIARIGGGAMTQTGVVMGTPMFMSPEQVLSHAVDARSDIFSVGVILYELLTYQNPFAADDVPTILYKILNEPIPPLATYIQNCPPQLESLVTRALARNREERFQTAEDMAFELQQVGDYIKRHMVEVYIQEGERFIAEGNFTLAKEALQKVLEVDSNHDVAKSLLGKVQEQLHAQQRAQKVEQGLHQARDAIQAEQFDDAVAALEEILRLEPGNDEARQLKQWAVEQRERSRKVKRHLAQAEKLVTAADWQGAKSQLESILALDPNHAPAQNMLGTVTKELAEQERLRLVRQHTEAARGHLNRKNFAQAVQLLEKARQLDPMNIEVESLLRLVRSGQEKEERRRLLDERLAGIQESLNREDYDKALHGADNALKEFPDDPQLLKLHVMAARFVETTRKRRFVDDQLAAAREFLEKNQFSSAMALLERALETAPDDARLSSFLKTIQEAQERATHERLRQEALREANEQVRAKDFAAAINTLEKALARAGQSPDLIEFLQLVREQQEEEQRQGRVRQVLARAQTCLREENFEEAVQVLERGKAELKAREFDGLLATAKEEWRKFERKREETISRAQELLRAGDAAKAVAALDAAPKSYFKNEKFQKVYAQCREGLGRATLVSNTVDQVERCIAREDLAQAEILLQQALKTYPSEPDLLAAGKKLQDEQIRFRRAMWGKLLDDAKVDLGRMKFREAIELLSSVDWDSAELPDLASEAKELLAEARRRESEAAEREAAHSGRRETIARAVPPLSPSRPSSSAAPPSGLISAQDRLREALKTAPPRSGELEKTRMAAPPAPPPVSRATAGPRGSVSSAVPATPQAQPPAPAARRTVPPKPVPPVVPQPPAVAPAPRAAKGAPVAVWLIAAVVVLAAVGVVIWRFALSARVGYAQVSAAPWAEVESVRTKAGKDMNLKGSTPIRLELPPGDYIVELKGAASQGSVEVQVKAGETAAVHYKFPALNVKETVDELVSKY